MHRFAFVLFAVFAPFIGASAQEGSQDTSQADERAVEAYEDALDAWTAAQAEHRKAYRSAETEEEQERIWSEESPDPDVFAPAFLAVASAHPGGAVALDCFGWVVGNAQDEKLVNSSLKVVLREHLRQVELGAFVETIARSSTLSVERALQTIFTSSPHREVKGKACYHLGMKKLSSARLARRVAELKEEGEDPFEAYKGYYTEVALTRAMALDPKVIQAVGEKLLDRVVNEFADIKGRRRTLGESAGAELFEIRNLQIGMMAPGIEGADVNEKPMKLSDFRGKVVLLDFWGDW